MLVEASTSSAMRRPGYDTSSRVKPGQRVGQRHGEERHAGHEQQQRQVPHERQRRPAHHRQQRRQRDLRPAARCRSSRQHEQHEHGDRQQDDEHEQRRPRLCELQIAPASPQPLVPRGAERDGKVFAVGTPLTRNPTSDRNACGRRVAARRDAATACQARPPACSSASALSSAMVSSSLGAAVAGRSQHAAAPRRSTRDCACLRVGTVPVAQPPTAIVRDVVGAESRTRAAAAGQPGTRSSCPSRSARVRPDDALADAAAERDRAGDAQRGGSTARAARTSSRPARVVLHAREGRRHAREQRRGWQRLDDAAALARGTARPARTSAKMPNTDGERERRSRRSSIASDERNRRDSIDANV